VCCRPTPGLDTCSGRHGPGGKPWRSPGRHN
jgi:hypothetical protein